jgi:hypothetical protein
LINQIHQIRNGDLSSVAAALQTKGPQPSTFPGYPSALQMQEIHTHDPSSSNLEMDEDQGAKVSISLLEDDEDASSPRYFVT